MKFGDIVTIYKDPKTMLKPEGKAELIEKIDSFHPTLEHWVVRFIDGNENFQRWIKKEATK